MPVAGIIAATVVASLVAAGAIGTLSAGIGWTIGANVAAPRVPTCQANCLTNQTLFYNADRSCWECGAQGFNLCAGTVCTATSGLAVNGHCLECYEQAVRGCDGAVWTDGAFPMRSGDCFVPVTIINGTLTMTTLASAGGNSLVVVGSGASQQIKGLANGVNTVVTSTSTTLQIDVSLPSTLLATCGAIAACSATERLAYNGSCALCLPTTTSIPASYKPVCGACTAGQTPRLSANGTCWDCFTEQKTCAQGTTCGANEVLTTNGTCFSCVSVALAIPAAYKPVCGACLTGQVAVLSANGTCYNCVTLTATSPLTATGLNVALDLSVPNAWTGAQTFANISVPTPVVASDAATKNYVDTTLAAGVPPAQEIGQGTSILNSTAAPYVFRKVLGDVGLQTAVVNNSLMIQFNGLANANSTIISMTPGSGMTNLVFVRADALYQYSRNPVTNVTVFIIEYFLAFNYDVSANPSVMIATVGTGWPTWTANVSPVFPGTCYPSASLLANLFAAPTFLLGYQSETTQSFGTVANYCTIKFMYQVATNAGL